METNPAGGEQGQPTDLVLYKDPGLGGCRDFSHLARAARRLRHLDLGGRGPLVVRRF